MKSITIHHVKNNLLMKTEKVDSLTELINMFKIKNKAKMVVLTEEVVEFREAV